jgi:hypothetical protein
VAAVEIWKSDIVNAANDLLQSPYQFALTPAGENVLTTSSTSRRIERPMAMKSSKKYPHQQEQPPRGDKDDGKGSHDRGDKAQHQKNHDVDQAI